MDTINRFVVGVSGDGIVILKQPVKFLTREEALNLAAWLVALADRNGEFLPLLEAVQNT